MRIRVVSIAILMIAALCNDARAEQTIVFFRHGDKPASGLGQLNAPRFATARWPFLRC